MNTSKQNTAQQPNYFDGSEELTWVKLSAGDRDFANYIVNLFAGEPYCGTAIFALAAALGALISQHDDTELVSVGVIRTMLEAAELNFDEDKSEGELAVLTEADALASEMAFGGEDDDETALTPTHSAPASVQ